MITSYSALLARLQQLIDGEDTSISTINTETLAHIINMGERRVYREVRSRHNEAEFNLQVIGNQAAIPADFESASVVHFGGASLKPVSEEWLREYNNRASGHPMYFCEAGTNFMFGAPIGDGFALKGRYFCRLPDLNPTTLPNNTLFAAEPDLFIFAALAESGGLFGADNDRRIPMWEQRYEMARDRVNTAKVRSAYSAGRMQMRPSSGPANYAPTAIYTAPTVDASNYADNYAEDYA